MASIALPAHTRSRKSTDDWITPKWLVDRLPRFDLDPCASLTQPWPCARRQLTVLEDGLLSTWDGFVWCNPPYGKQAAAWLNRMALHDNGVALVFARTDTRMFFESVWPFASALLFLRGRLTFHRPDGSPSPNGHNSGGPSVLIGYGARALQELAALRDLGALTLTADGPLKLMASSTLRSGGTAWTF